MKYAYYTKIPAGPFRNNPDFATTTTKNLLKRLYKKGHVSRNITVDIFDQDADNFVKNVITMRATADLFKAPRIVQRVTAKKHMAKA